MHDFLCALVRCLTGMAKVIGPWPAVVVTAMFLFSFTFLSFHVSEGIFHFLNHCIDAALAAFFFFRRRQLSETSPHF